MPISQETKDQIDDIATDIAALETGKERRQEINAALTNYAEKLEEKDRIIESKDIELTVWKDTADKFKRLAEEKDKAYNKLGVKFDKEVERWQERDANEVEKRRVLESEIERLKYDLDASVKALVETYKKQDRELAQLKEIGSRLFNSLRDLDFMLSVFDPRVSQNDIRIKVFTLMDMAEKLNGANKT